MNEPNSDHKPAIVILNMHFTGLGIARDARNLGVPVVGLSHNEDFYGHVSKDCEPLLFPDTETDPSGAYQFLLDLSHRFTNKPLLLPTRDHDIRFLIDHRDLLQTKYTIPFPNNEIWNHVLNKDRVYSDAESVNIRCPRSHVVESIHDLEALKDQLSYPCVIKPVVSAHWRNQRVWKLVGQQKMMRVESYEQLNNFYVSIAETAPLAHIQDYIAGPDTNIVVFCSFLSPTDQTSCYFTAQKLVQYPPYSGTGVAMVAKPIPSIVAPSMKLLKQLRYYGVSEIEYKLDQQSGEYVLIEVNPRHWDQHRLGAKCGVNLTRAMFNNFCGGHTNESIQIETPTYWVADDNFLLSLLSNLKSRDYPLSSYSKALFGKKVWAVHDWKDLRPSLKAWKRFFGQLFRLVFKR